MNIKKFIQLVEQADIPNMKVLGQLDDGFAYIQYNGMAGVLDQQGNKMILISPKAPDSFHIVTIDNGRETTQYVGGRELGPATKKALDSITPRRRSEENPLPVQETYESNIQVRRIVQRMMEDARVPQKPRQGPLRPQTGAGKHKDKKKDQKQGKEKHKGKSLDESTFPFAGLGKHKIGRAGQLRSPGPTGYPKGKLVGGAAESRFGRHRDDQFSLGGRMPRTDRIDRDSSSGQDAQQRMERKLKQQTIDRLLDRHPEWERSDLELASLPELIQMLRENQSKKLGEGLPMADYTKYSTETLMNMLKILKKNPEKEKITKAVSKELVRRSQGLSEAAKKPNATTRHLRDYPVSDKDVAKPVKKPEKKKPEQGVAEGERKLGPAPGQSTPNQAERAKSRDHQRTDAAKKARDASQRKGLKQDKDGTYYAKEGVAEGSGKNVVKSVKVGNFRHDLVDTGMGWQVRIYNGDELYDTGMSKNSEQKGLAALEDAVAYTEKQTRTKRQGVAEGEGKTQKYEMMMRNGQVKKFVAKDDADAKRIAAGHGAKSVIRLRGGIPAGKVAEQGVSEGWGFDQWGHDTWTDAQKEVARKKKNEKQRAQRQQNKDQQNKDQRKSKEQGVAEEKQKGVDGKACWKGYKRMGTKKKGGRTVDNCVKMESISEGILSSFGLMEKSPPGFKGTVKAMKKHPELTKGKTKDGKEKNPWALAWHMKNKGYKSHKKADGSDKD